MLANFKELSKPKEIITDEKVKIRLFDVLDNAVRSLVEGHKEIPVAFSGGIDSSILVYLISKYAKPILFCVGFKNSYDMKNAKKTAELLNLKVNFIYLDDFDLKEYLEKTIDLIGANNKLVVDLNVPIFILTEEIKKKGYKNFISGQGADTLLCGFAKYAYTNNLENDLFNDIKNIYKTNLQYNFKVCGYFEINIIYPFLEKEVVELAIKISPELKIKNGVNKYILREAFRNYLPEEIINQNKKALQYGSGISKALEKIKKR